MTKKSAPVTSQQSPPAIQLVKLASRTPALKSFGGSNSDDWNNANFNMVLRALGRASNPEQENLHSEYVYAGLAGIDPRDELEGMMAAQIVALHVASMDVIAKGTWPDNPPEQQRLYLAAAAKLSRAMTGLVDALNRHRGKGTAQTVTVEHVHVHRHMHTHEDAGGDLTKLEEQAHAQVLTHAPVAPMLSAHAQRDALPIPKGRRPAKVQNARRKQGKRRAKRE